MNRTGYRGHIPPLVLASFVTSGNIAHCTLGLPFVKMSMITMMTMIAILIVIGILKGYYADKITNVWHGKSAQ